MYCRSRPQYRSDLGWISGVAFLGTLTRSARPVQGFTCVRCCSMPPASSPHGLAAPGLGRLTTAIPACSCLQLAVATNSLRRGLPPPIQCPCLAHQAPRQKRAATRLQGLTARATEHIRHPCRKSNPMIRQPALMQFCSGQLMQFLSGVDTRENWRPPLYPPQRPRPRMLIPVRLAPRVAPHLGRLAFRFANHSILQSKSGSAVERNLSPIHIPVA